VTITCKRFLIAGAANRAAMHSCGESTMGLRAKFNLALLAAFSIGFLIAAVLLYRATMNSAREEVVQNARIMMAAADAIRKYTAQDLAPLLPLVVKDKFVAENIPAYAAQRNFRELHAAFPGIYYREPALNPTNPANRPQDWEADIINVLRNEPGRHELIAERDTPTGATLNLARPISVRDEACLLCHGRASLAHPALTSTYGATNGFGWKLNETVGAQIVSVPMELAVKRGREAFVIFLAVLAGIVAAMFAVLNILLHRLVIRPVMRVSAIADAVSLGKADVETYIKPGKDEISSLSVAFDRMRQNLDHAMQTMKA
jgi:HAMP domain-containing protein